MVENIRLWGYWNSGQDCTAATRVIAGPAIYDRLVAELSDRGPHPERGATPA